MYSHAGAWEREKRYFTTESTEFYLVNCACGAVNHTKFFSVPSVVIPGVLPYTLWASLQLFKFVPVKFVCGELFF
jgi:hypothetical protein